MYNILLTASGSNVDLATILSIITGLVIIGLVLFYLYKVKYKDCNKALNDFLAKIEDIAKKRIIELIENVDITDIKGSYLEFQDDFILNLYKDIYDLTMNELVKYDKSVIAAFLKKNVTPEVIENLTRKIIEEGSIQDKLSDLSNELFKLRDDQKEILTEGEDVEVFEGDKSVEELDPNELDPLAKGDEEKINPPVDEEKEVYESNDESIEILDK